ncbi:hypothetical protein AHiyo8_63030 [Arthrobacter sp. Hiyo8]|nr:hypothetical protein AHiyo8_63030 [Arthrobacter sp. Hiyo8]
MSDQPQGELVCNANEIQVKQALRILIDDYPVAIVKDSMGRSTPSATPARMPTFRLPRVKSKAARSNAGATAPSSIFAPDSPCSSLPMTRPRLRRHPRR